MNMYQLTKKRGYALLLSMLIASIVLAIGITMFNLTIKSLRLSSSARESVFAIYAADAGIECALFWDLRGVEAAFGGEFVFATSTDSFPRTTPVNCFGNDIRTSGAGWNVTTGATGGTTTFEVNFSPEPFCAQVEIAKIPSSTAPSISNTSLVSRGYNTPCTALGVNTVERAIRVTY